MASMDAISRNLMLDSLREYAKRRIPFDLIRELDEKNEFPADILREMYDRDTLGVHLLMIPEEYGGVSGGTFDIYRICEALARIDLGIATGVFATFLGTDPLNQGGTEEQKEKWLRRIASENLLVAYGAKRGTFPWPLLAATVSPLGPIGCSAGIEYLARRRRVA